MESKIYKASDFDFETRRLSYSTLKHILKSPLHFAHNWFEPRKPPTPAMLLGSLVDCLLFEPEKFDDRFVKAPSTAKRSKADLIEWAKFYLQHIEVPIIEQHNLVAPDATMEMSEVRWFVEVIKEHFKKLNYKSEDLEVAQAMVDRLKEHPFSSRLIKNTMRVQKRLEWRDKKTGLPLVGYMDADAEIEGLAIVWDLKTAADGADDSFSKAAANFDYPLQAACYFNAYAQNYGQFADFYYSVIESTPPFAINVLRADSNFMELGKQMYRTALDRVAYCLENDCFNEDYTFMTEANYNQLYLPGWKLRELM